MPKLGRRGEFSGTAPFGTNDTPTFRPRIIGGNVVTVIESPVSTNLDPFANSYISEKPNNVDPRALNDFTKRYNQPYQDPFHKRNDYIRPSYVTRRPDSKDISSRYPTLAPIDGNRIKNQQMSTVFEPEAWTKRYYSEKDSLFWSTGDVNHETGNNQSRRLENGYATGPANYRSQGYSSPSAGESLQMSDEKFKAMLMSMIPKGVFLPETPIILSQKEEMRLLNILTSELYYNDPLKLRDAYLDISNRVDKQLSGYCQYHDLYHTFSRISFKFPQDLLQLVAAMFVSNHRKQGDVNYEKFLSFVGVALKNKDKIKPPRSNQEYPYYDNSKETSKPDLIRYRPGSPFFSDGGETKLLRMVKEQLSENDFIIDLGQLMASFQQEDKNLRGTLSSDQIKNICFQHRIPIQESLITSILHRCQDNSRNQQYNWYAFVRYLERVQPMKTGTPIPSKQSLEYARNLPSSVSGWPKGDALSQGHNSRASWNQEIPKSHRMNDVPDVNIEIISRMDNQLRDLERHYEELKFKSPHKKEDGSWFKNFLKFADALYRQDERFEGRLPFNDVAEWTNIYNKTFQLEIPDSEISMALSQSTRKGHVDIHKFLSLLRKQY